MNTPASRDTSRLRWAYVAFFGALWGGVEITIGAFLHTVRVPFAGLFLASFSASLMVAQRQLCPQRGTTLATGVVAALLKSLSPGGIILGPMIGISVEALLVELVLLPRPRSRPLAMLAGASAALWASTQGLLTQVILYGAELLELYLGVLRRLAELLGLHTDYAYLSMLGLTLVLALPGVVGGLWGHRLGRRVIARLEQGQLPVSMVEQLPHQGLAGDERVVRHRLLLAPVVALALGLQFGRSLGLAVAALLLLLTALGIWARPALRALWLPRFWLFSLLLSLAAAVLLAPAREGGWLIGLEAGLRMVLRAALFFALFSWLARAIRPSELVHFWAKIGLRRMGEAIALALRLLPAFVAVFEGQLNTLRTTPGVRKKWHLLQELVASTMVQCVLWARASIEAPSTRSKEEQ